MDFFLLCMESVLGIKGFSFFLGSFHEDKILLLSAHYRVMDTPFLLDIIIPKSFETGTLFSSIYCSKKGLP